MTLYVNRYDEHMKQEGENPSIGLILCRENDHFLLKYALPKDNEQIFAQEYKTYLPDRELLQNKLDDYMQTIENI